MSKPPSERHPAAIGKLLEHPIIQALSLHPTAAKALCREEAQRQRDGNFPVGSPLEGGAERIAETTQSILSPGYPKVINATGVLLHTGLGRALLADAAITAMMEAAQSCYLELDQTTGNRGDRWQAVERKLTLLTGAEAALVVNNCASAVLLALNTIANKKTAIVSRGELVEIGGGFRMPEVMNRAGVKRVEVGTTNRTRLSDFRDAITPQTAALLKIHPSNYRIIGFTEAPNLSELVALADEHSLPVFEDLGNGLLFDISQFGLPAELTVYDSLNAGVHVVAVSGDKCLGGPQAGILLGKREWIAKCKKNHLLRAIRPDKLTLAALDATLALWLSNRQCDIPFYAMLSAPIEQLFSRANAVLQALTVVQTNYTLSVEPDEAMIGSGTMPQSPFPDVSLTIRSHSIKPAQLAKRLRTHTVPIIPVVKDDTLRIHFRSILPKNDSILSDSLRTLLY
ncbi:MAG: L-seryl-tRNA(Sec) selenium transferase [bacterium]|nr:L-seryl-tRNA(Sec) selenium transferase [bacterium]